jgi:hypothetical protein
MPAGRRQQTILANSTMPSGPSTSNHARAQSLERSLQLNLAAVFRCSLCCRRSIVLIAELTLRRKENNIFDKMCNSIVSLLSPPPTAVSDLG